MGKTRGPSFTLPKYPSDERTREHLTPIHREVHPEAIQLMTSHTQNLSGILNKVISASQTEGSQGNTLRVVLLVVKENMTALTQ